MVEILDDSINILHKSHLRAKDGRQEFLNLCVNHLNPISCQNLA